MLYTNTNIYNYQEYVNYRKPLKESQYDNNDDFNDDDDCKDLTEIFKEYLD